jgi:hypothetical protein
LNGTICITLQGTNQALQLRVLGPLEMIPAVVM